MSRSVTAKLVDIAKLKPYARNARTHSDEQIEQLKESIRRFGFVTAILYDDKGIVAGHARQRAVNEMIDAGEDIPGPGRRLTLPKGKIPGIDVSGLSDGDRRALILADNQLAVNAGWDEALLADEIRQLIEADIDVDVIGFDDAELNALIRQLTNESEEEEVPEPPEVPVSRAGDIWVLGSHRIICGSCTDAETVNALLGDERPNLMVTDPPYGVEYDANWRNECVITTDGGLQRKSTGHEGRKVGARAIGKVMNDDKADWREAWELFKGDIAYVWHAGLKAHIVAESLLATGFEIRAQIVWAKSQLVIGRGDYHPQHKPLWYAVRKGKPGCYIGGRKQTTLWQIDKPRSSETGHSTQKPIECMKRPIENNSKIGEAIYEPFSGSGTTIIAAEMCHRRCFAIELNPAYVDVAVERWQEHTKSEAILLGDGRTFSQISTERLSSEPELDDVEITTDLPLGQE